MICGMFDFTKGIAPCLRNNVMISESSASGLLQCHAHPVVASVPAIAMWSFTDIGIPWSEPQNVGSDSSWIPSIDCKNAVGYLGVYRYDVVSIIYCLITVLR